MHKAYTSDGHAVHVKIYEKDSGESPESPVYFTCEDTGIGMSEEYSTYLKNFPEKHTTTENKVCWVQDWPYYCKKSMIELMGGSIQVESTQGVDKIHCRYFFDMASEVDVYRTDI